MDKFNNDKFNVVELSTSEFLDINGGSQKSYSNGYAAGAAVRKFIDNATMEWAILKWIF